jgi:O-antigen ligase
MQAEITSLSFFNLSKKIATVSAILLGFSIPVSTGLDSLLLALLLLTALVGWNTQYSLIITQNPVAKAALLLFGILFIGCFYGDSQINSGIKVLTKYDDLILVALLIPVYTQPKMRLYGQYVFMATMMLTLILSYLIWLGAFQHTGLFSDRLPENPVVFKLHITHGILMGFATFMFTVYAIFAKGKNRWLLISASILAICNVLLMTQGRTGYLVVIALAIYLILAMLHWRSILLCIVLITVASTGIYEASPKIQSRVTLAVHEAKSWKPMQGNNEASSIGTRMDYYTNAIKIISKHPLFGVGTGGFEAAYAKEIEGSAVASSNNPHNQFLLFLAQTGLFGLAAFLYLIWIAWKSGDNLPSPSEKLLARGLLITITTGCIFNSLLLDHTEGLFFAWFCGLFFAGLPSRKQSK